jgi:hypothetical protein
VHMDAWDNDYPDLIKPTLLPSTKAARVSSYSAPSKADLTAANRNGRPVVEFSWEGVNSFEGRK